MRLSFSDCDGERAFWERMSGYCVEIDGTDYELAGGCTFDLETGAVLVDVKVWDDEEGKGVGEELTVPVGPESEVSVY